MPDADTQTKKDDKQPPLQIISLDDLKNKLVVLATPAATANPAPAERTGLKVFALSVSMVKGLAWPLLLIILVFLYHDSIRKTFDELPNLISHAQKLSVGGLSVEIETQALQKGGVGLAQVLNKLSPKDIEQLLLTGTHYIIIVGTTQRTDEYTLPNPAVMESLGNLEKNGLVKFTNREGHRISLQEFEAKFKALPWAKQANQDKMGDSERVTFRLARPLSQDEKFILQTEYSVTDLGKTAFDSVITAIAQQLPLDRNKK